MIGASCSNGSGRAVAWSQFDGKLTVVDLDGPSDERAKSSAVIDVSFKPTAAEREAGF